MPFNSQSLAAAADAGPSLDPQSVYGIASSASDPSVAYVNAGAAHGYAQITTETSTLTKQSTGVQRKVWGSLDDNTKQLYLSAGYKPPPAAAPSHGFFGSIASSVGNVASTVLGGATHEITSGVGSALHAIGAPLRGLQHLERSAMLLDDEAAQQGQSRWWHSLPTVDEFHKAWKDSTSGDRTFRPGTVAKLTQQYGADVVNVAKQVAGGTKPEDIIARAVDDASKEALRQQMTSPAFSDAVGQLNNAKYSLGRALVGEHLLNSHPALGKVLSGLADATADLVTDPVVLGGKFAKAAELAPYIARSQEAVAHIFENEPAVQRFAQVVADAVSNGGDGIAQLTRRMPKLDGVAEELLHLGADTPEKVADYFKNGAGLTSILTGRAGGVAGSNMFVEGGNIVPHVTALTRVTYGAKDLATKAIDFGANLHLPGPDGISSIVNAVPSGIQKLTSLTPTTVAFNPYEKDAVTQLRRLADYSLPHPQADHLIGAFLDATEPGQKKAIYEGLVRDVLHGMNWDQPAIDRFFSQLDETATRAYGINDSVSISGQDTNVGFLAKHASDEWTLPDYRMASKQADRAAVLQQAYGALNSDLVDRFMQNAWKPLQLLRMGFPVRTGGEELVGAIMRDGPLKILRARVAASLNNESAYSPVEHALDTITSHLPGPVADKINTARDVTQAVLVDRAAYALQDVAKKASGEELNAAAGELHDLFGGGLLNEEVSSLANRGAGMVADPMDVRRAAASGVQTRAVWLKGSGDYRGYDPGSEFFPNLWEKNLGDIATDRFSKPAVEMIGEGYDKQVAAVESYLRAESGSGQFGKQFVRAFQDRYGAVVGTDIPQEDALRDWAQVITDNVNHLVSQPDGTLHTSIVDAIQGGDVPNSRVLAEIPTELRPSTVVGPDKIELFGDGKWQQFMNRGFEHVGRAMNWLGRQPMFLNNYAESRKLMEESAPYFERLGITGEALDQHLQQLSLDRATGMTVPFIHDPEVRSQFAEDYRNLMPFMFAQEQFYKRWAKTLYHSPESFREAQLAVAGLRHMGFLHNDGQGNDYFMYPGAGAVQQVLNKGWQAMTGTNVMLPVPVGFSGQLRFVSPGTERLGMPSFGPLVALPMGLLARRFPELAGAEQSILGDRGAGRSIADQLVPSSVMRIYHAMNDSPDNSAQMHSAVLSAIQYMESTGHGLAEDASPLEREQYLDRITQWARVVMLNRAIFGFAAPAAPEAQFDPQHLNEEFRSLLSEGIPIDQATKDFLAAHPDASPFTVFQSKSESGAAIPSTDSAMQFMTNHDRFLKTYPQAGPWFVPQTSDKGGFSPAAYREQLALQLRTRRTPDEFYRQIKFTEAADQYFTSVDAVDKALAAAKGNPNATRVIQQNWAQAKQGFLAAHPVFAEELQSPQGNIRRQQTLIQLRQAFADPSLPQSPQSEAIRNLLGAFDSYQSAISPLSGLRTTQADNIRKALRLQFINAAHAFVTENPDAAPIYNRVFRFEVGDQTDVGTT